MVPAAASYGMIPFSSMDKSGHILHDKWADSVSTRIIIMGLFDWASFAPVIVPAMHDVERLECQSKQRICKSCWNPKPQKICL